MGNTVEILRRMTGTVISSLLGMKSAKALYWLSVRRRSIGLHAGELIVTGQIETEVATSLPPPMVAHG